MSDQESGNEKPQVEDGEEEPQTSAEPEQAEARSSETPEEPESVPSEIVLQHELDQAKEQAHEYLEGWQRARAEFANYKKRVTRDKEESRMRIAAETLTKYLGVIDDLERALKDRPEDGEAAAWAEGIELIYRKMYGVLDTEGVEIIEADGEFFDPKLHEAISHDESEDHEEGEIIEVVQPGYRMGDRVLRPAMVRVAK
ncbi:MAG: nucleotide exchange factor GrpE [Chloroflexi bacterium]|nr:nucleotide exchange factor GrpE [Chloroflexota bacterium]MCI0892213.1 nucleotide exchange factor GrpE [Chloroflexota bacterium]